MPASILAIRLATRFACASGSTGPSSRPDARRADASARVTRWSAQAWAKSARASAESTWPSAHNSSRASACLQGNFRLGHEQR